MYCPIGSRGMADNNRLECMGSECAFWREETRCLLVSAALMFVTLMGEMTIGKWPEIDPGEGAIIAQMGERIFTREEVLKAGE